MIQTPHDWLNKFYSIYLISNNTERCSYKGGYYICELSIEEFKRRAGLGYRLIISGYLLFKIVSYTTEELNNKAVLI